MNFGVVFMRGLVVENEFVRKSFDRNKFDIFME